MPLFQRLDVIARRAMPDVAISFDDLLRTLKEQYPETCRRLPHQCAHWFAMTYDYRFSFSNFSINWTSFSTPSIGMAL